MIQTHYTEPSSDEDVIMGSFLAVSVNEDANIANRKDCTKCPNKQVTPETEGNVPSNTIKSDLIFID